MQALKATTAHEIDRASVTERPALVFEGRAVPDETPTMQAGDFYFKQSLYSREVKASFWARLIGRKTRIVINTVESVIISCPFCGLPIMTAPTHKIVAKNPLTIENKITCPYQGSDTSHAFTITEGNIIAV